MTTILTRNLMKQSICIFIGLCFIFSKIHGVQFIDTGPSYGSQLAKALGEAATNIGEGFAERRAAEQAEAYRFNCIYAHVLVLLKGYSRQSHKNFMKQLSKSPDLSYSLKTGLISHYDEYRQSRDDLDSRYNSEYKQILNDILSIQPELFSEVNNFIELSLYINPHVNQKELKERISQINLDQQNNRKLRDFIKRYYQERIKLDQWSHDVEKSLITFLG